MNAQNIDFTVDKDNLYKESSITDLKVGAIRMLSPITSGGEPDTERDTVFIGHTQLMSPEGPIPLQARLDAKNLEEAMQVFPAEMEKAMVQMQEQVRQYQQEQSREKSNIITPGR